MKRKDDRYEQWVERIKHCPPVLKDSELLTEEVISKIEIVSSFKNQKSRKYWGTWISGVAATLLICFWISEEVVSHSGAPLPSAKALVIPNIYSGSISEEMELSSDRMTISKKLKRVNTAIRTHQKNQLKKKEFYSGIVNKSMNKRIKCSAYENE